MMEHSKDRSGFCPPPKYNAGQVWYMINSSLHYLKFKNKLVKVHESDSTCSTELSIHNVYVQSYNVHGKV